VETDIEVLSQSYLRDTFFARRKRIRRPISMSALTADRGLVDFECLFLGLDFLRMVTALVLMFGRSSQVDHLATQSRMQG
jgi:hypothetical protein